MMYAPANVVEGTLDILRRAGAQKKECVVLWLADRTNRAVVREAYRPDHEADCDRFWIPSEAMDALMTHIRERKLSLAAQVHSHPGEAFHSTTDDRYAIVRHVGALSIVVPRFALETAVDAFLKDCVFFEHAADNRWIEIMREALPSTFNITA